MRSYITYFEIAAFIASIAAWNTIKKSRYLRLYPLLLFVIVVVEVYETFFRDKLHWNNAAIYNIQVPLQYLIYFAILYRAMINKIFKKALSVLSVFFIITAIITEIYLTREGSFNSWSYSLGSVIAIAGILAKFNEMLQNPDDFRFTDNPFFYMLFAFLVFNVGTLPYFVMGNWLWFDAHDKTAVILLQNVMSVLNYLLYSTYTIALLCMMKKRTC